MCAIFGALLADVTRMSITVANSYVDHIMRASIERGRDGWGYYSMERRYQGDAVKAERRCTLRNAQWPDTEFFNPFRFVSRGHLIGNMRAEPTTEYVAQKNEFDQQPYRLGKWTIVHNGTIANDHAIRNEVANGFHPALPTTIDSAAIVELLSRKEDFDSPVGLTEWFKDCIAQLKGSYAILAVHDDYCGIVLAACNYRPIWFAKHPVGTFFASSRDYFPSTLVPQMVPPYSMWAFTADGRSRLDNVMENKGRALVVCSGGMDSVVAAAAMIDAGFDVSLVHFRYGSRAQGPEVEAVSKVASRLGVNLYYHTIDVYEEGDSPLLQADSAIAGGEAGAEFAHEWVPARNLLMLATATAMAEAKGFDTLVLGNNLEEAGAYPDNEPEFINRFNDMLPFAVGDGKRMRVVMPVGNLMKHEIVALGEQLGAPMDLTWSCYRAGEVHCGKCGPCYMRKTAYTINGLADPLPYAE